MSIINSIKNSRSQLSQSIDKSEFAKVIYYLSPKESGLLLPKEKFMGGKTPMTIDELTKYVDNTKSAEDFSRLLRTRCGITSTKKLQYYCQQKTNELARVVALATFINEPNIAQKIKTLAKEYDKYRKQIKKMNQTKATQVIITPAHTSAIVNTSAKAVFLTAAAASAVMGGVGSAGLAPVGAIPAMGKIAAVYLSNQIAGHIPVVAPMIKSATTALHSLTSFSHNIVQASGNVAKQFVTNVATTFVPSVKANVAMNASTLMANPVASSVVPGIVGIIPIPSDGSMMVGHSANAVVSSAEMLTHAALSGAKMNAILASPNIVSYAIKNNIKTKRKPSELANYGFNSSETSSLSSQQFSNNEAIPLDKNSKKYRYPSRPKIIAKTIFSVPSAIASGVVQSIKKGLVGKNILSSVLTKQYLEGPEGQDSNRSESNSPHTHKSLKVANTLGKLFVGENTRHIPSIGTVSGHNYHRYNLNRINLWTSRGDANEKHKNIGNSAKVVVQVNAHMHIDEKGQIIYTHNMDKRMSLSAEERRLRGYVNNDQTLAQQLSSIVECRKSKSTEQQNRTVLSINIRSKDSNAGPFYPHLVDIAKMTAENLQTNGLFMEDKEFAIFAPKQTGFLMEMYTKKGTSDVIMHCHNPKLNQGISYEGPLEEVSKKMKNHLDICCKGQDAFHGFNPNSSVLSIKTTQSLAGKASNIVSKIKQKAMPRNSQYKSLIRQLGINNNSANFNVRQASASQITSSRSPLNNTPSASRRISLV